VDTLNGKVKARCKVTSFGPSNVRVIEILGASKEQFEEALNKVIGILEDEELVERSHVDRQMMQKLSKKPINEQIQEITSVETFAFLIPFKKTSSVIGPKGVTIKKLQKDHEVKLMVEKQDSSYTNLGRIVLVQGTIEKIGECFAAISAKIFDGKDCTVVILLPSGFSRFVVGACGVTVKRIEKYSGCKLNLEHAERVEYCQISGKLDKVAKGVQGVMARVAIQQRVLGVTSEAAISKDIQFGGPGFVANDDKRASWKSSLCGAGSQWRSSNVQGDRLYLMSSSKPIEAGYRGPGWPSSSASKSGSSFISSWTAGSRTGSGGLGTAKLWKPSNKRNLWKGGYKF